VTGQSRASNDRLLKYILKLPDRDDKDAPLVEVPFAVIGGGLLSKTGRYKPLHFFAFGIMVLGLGLFSRSDRDTSKTEWVIVQMLPAFGLGFMMSTTVAAVQADLGEELTAATTAAFSFMRAYGSILGVGHSCGSLQRPLRC
jgi:hypothetical protein